MCESVAVAAAYTPYTPYTPDKPEYWEIGFLDLFIDVFQEVQNQKYS